MSPKSSESHLEQRFERIWSSIALDLPLEHQKKNIIPGRRYVFDFYEPKSRVLFEINGGLYARGHSGHTSASGIMRDYDKVNQAQLQGYHCFALAPDFLTKEYLETLAHFCRTYATTTGKAQTLG